ncbi:hypothetical protein LINPERPRIM_LOCUS8373 [Linum perenne]
MIADTGIMFQAWNPGEVFYSNRWHLHSPLSHIFSRYGGLRSVGSSSSRSLQELTAYSSGYSWDVLPGDLVERYAILRTSMDGIENQSGLKCGLLMANMHLPSVF